MREALTSDEMMQIVACFRSRTGDIRTLSFFSSIDWVDIWTGLLDANDEYLYADIKRQMLADQMQEMAQPEKYV